MTCSILKYLPRVSWRRNGWAKFLKQTKEVYELGKIELYKDRKKEWRFRVVGRNGRIIVASEGYASRRNARLGIDSLMKILDEGVDVVEV